MSALPHLDDVDRDIDERRSRGAAPAVGLPEREVQFDGVRFAYPGTRRTVHDGLSFRAEAGEQLRAQIGLIAAATSAICASTESGGSSMKSLAGISA